MRGNNPFPDNDWVHILKILRNSIFKNPLTFKDLFLFYPNMKKLFYIIKNLLFVTVPTILIILIILELVFRIAVSESDMPVGFFDENDKMFLFYDKGGRGMTAGSTGETDVVWRINNMGWNYPIDYDQTDNKKMIAVIGDSFIEALLINVDKNYPYLLHRMLFPDYRVYAFGKSGAPLSQYLHISRYVNKYFNPDILIINVVHNDFDESIYELYPKKTQFMQLSINKDKHISEISPRGDPKISFERFRWWKKLLYRSALFRYVSRQSIAVGNRAFLRFYPTNFEANVRVDKINEHRDSIYLAVNYIVEKIRTENKDKRIIFLLDGSRYAIYNDRLDYSKVLWMHEMMKQVCSVHNAEFYDLNPVMLADYKANKTMFNSETDGHWNEYGHSFVAEFLYEVITGKRNN